MSTHLLFTDSGVVQTTVYNLQSQIAAGLGMQPQTITSPPARRRERLWSVESEPDCSLLGPQVIRRTKNFDNRNVFEQSFSKLSFGRGKMALDVRTLNARHDGFTCVIISVLK